MSIRFSCEITDPHVEALLLFLGARLDDDKNQMIDVLDCAKAWLKLESPIPFDRSAYEHVKSSLVLVHEEDDKTSLAPSQKPLPPAQV